MTLVQTDSNPHIHPLGKLKYSLDWDDSDDRTLRRVYRVIGKLGKRSMLFDSEPTLLYDIPRLLGGGDMANLGHSRGGSAFLLAHSLKFYNLPGKVLSMDEYAPDYNPTGKKNPKFRNRRVVENIAAEAKRRNEMDDLYGLGGRLDFRIATTQAIGEQCQANGETFRFIFVDADHSYEGVLGDFKTWSPLLEVGGWIAFHDTDQEHTHRVLNEKLIDNPRWKEHKELHVSRIRVFERETFGVINDPGSQNNNRRNNKGSNCDNTCS